MCDIEQNIYRREIVAQLLTQIRPREEAVIRARFMDNLSIAEIAKELRLSRESIRLIEARAIRRLQAIVCNMKRAGTF